MAPPHGLASGGVSTSAPTPPPLASGCICGGEEAPMSTPLAGRVAVITLGGTIAMTSQSGDAVTPTLTADDLVAAVPGLDGTGIDVQVLNFRQLPGASLSFTDLLALAQEIRRLDVDGVVVTQGTDTIEETAYFLDLFHSGPKPLVVTGAMRNASMAGADGPANILAGVRVAASPHAQGLGCVVVFAEEIHAARWVRKTHSASPTAFTSYPGPIGYVAEDRVTLWTHPSPHTLDLAAQPSRALENADRIRTAVATLGLGDDGVVLDAIGAHVDGLVVAAFGVGHAPVACVDALTKLAARIPVVLASRTGSGPVMTRTYGFPGSESDLISRGLIPASDLNPLKARIRLHTLLLAEVPHAEISKHFTPQQ